MAIIEPSPDYGMMQKVVEELYRSEKFARRLDAVILAESYDLPKELIELVELLPPGTYDRQGLCDQLNSSINGHGWGLIYGTVE